MTGSTVAGVAARSSVPVVSVPEDWRGPVPAANVVTVGVQHPDESEAVVRLGIDEARLRGAEVVVLHAWYLDGGYDSVVADADYRAQQQRKVTEAITPTLDRSGTSTPTCRSGCWCGTRCRSARWSKPAPPHGCWSSGAGTTGSPRAPTWGR